MRSAVLAFLLGVCLLQGMADLPPRWLAGALLAPLLFLGLVLGRGRWLVWLLLGLCWALWRAQGILEQTLPASLEGSDLVVEGRVLGIPRRLDRGQRFDFMVEADLRDDLESSLPRRLRLSWYGPAPLLAPGERWRLTVRLKRPRGFMNPGGFDYEGWLFRHGIGATGYVRGGPAAGTRLEAGTAASLDALRHRLWKRLRALDPPLAHGGLVAALALGERQGMDKEQWRVLTGTGTSHLLAISGLHVGLVAGLGFALGRALGTVLVLLGLRLAAPHVAAVAGLLAAAGYAALAGFSIPTQRALIMVAVVMLALLAGRRVATVDLLLGALAAVLILDPLAVLAAGFWLSFGAVAVIVLGMAGRVGTPGLWWRWGRVHWVAAVGLAPLLAALFGYNPVLGPLANALAVPWVSLLVVPLTLGGVALLPLSAAIAEGLLRAADAALALLWPTLTLLADPAWSAWRVPVPRGWALGAAVVGTVLLLSPRGLPGRWLGLLWLLPALAAGPPRPPPGEAWLTVLDVGQGLAAVVQTRERLLVFDAGPRFSREFDAGGAVLVPYLRHWGLAHIDTLVLSHGDSDHAGGLDSVLRELPVGRILAGEPDAIAHPRVGPCRDGQHWTWDGVRFEMLHPPEGFRPRRRNDHSCVLKVTAASGRSALLTGDIEGQSERRLLQARAARLSADVLVVPHHGSLTSSSPGFVQAVTPVLALMPAGHGNRWGFPHPRVLERYRAVEAGIWSTGGAGALRVELGSAVPRVQAHRLMARRYWQAAAELYPP